MRKLIQEEYIDKIHKKLGEDFTVLSQYDGSDSKITLQHKCGRTFTRTAKSWLYDEFTCPCEGGHVKIRCREDYVARFNEIYSEDEYSIESDYCGLSKVLDVKHIPCGIVHHRKAEAYIRRPKKCNCKTPMLQTKKLSTEEFKRRFYNEYSADEYEVISEYTAYDCPITVLHKKCGGTRTRTADNWLREKAKFVCECEAPEDYMRVDTENKFRKKFEELYGDRFKVVSYDKLNEPIKIKHKKCGNVFTRMGYTILNGNMKCPCEFGRDFVPEINSIAVLDPDFANLFLNPEDPWKYSLNSSQRSNFKCPDCGTIEYNRRISDVHRYGVKCPVCKTGHSIGEKIVYSILSLCLDQLSDYKFYYDSTTEWSDKKRYDFIFSVNHINYIAETHGMQHYKKVFGKKFPKSLEEEQLNDKYKYELAITKGKILPENYIEIDCRESDHEYIKNSILNSRLSEVLDLSNIDWSECFKNALFSEVKIVCDAWNNGLRTQAEFVDAFHMNYSTILKYLQRGASAGLCDYCDKRKSKVRCKNDGNTFESIMSAIRHYNLPTHTNTNIGKACKGLVEYAGIHPITGEKMMWEYIT